MDFSKSKIPLDRLADFLNIAGHVVLEQSEILDIRGEVPWISGDTVNRHNIERIIPDSKRNIITFEFTNGCQVDYRGNQEMMFIADHAEAIKRFQETGEFEVTAKWNIDDNCYYAECAMWPHTSAWGSTKEKAIEQYKIMMAPVIEAAQKIVKAVPV